MNEYSAGECGRGSVGGLKDVFFRTEATSRSFEGSTAQLLSFVGGIEREREDPGLACVLLPSSRRELNYMYYHLARTSITAKDCQDRTKDDFTCCTVPISPFRRR